METSVSYCTLVLLHDVSACGSLCVSEYPVNWSTAHAQHIKVHLSHNLCKLQSLYEMIIGGCWLIILVTTFSTLCHKNFLMCFKEQLSHHC